MLRAVLCVSGRWNCCTRSSAGDQSDRHEDSCVVAEALGRASSGVCVATVSRSPGTGQHDRLGVAGGDGAIRPIFAANDLRSDDKACRNSSPGQRSTAVNGDRSTSSRRGIGHCECCRNDISSAACRRLRSLSVPCSMHGDGRGTDNVGHAAVEFCRELFSGFVVEFLTA
jgi:hypothetical protein